MTTLDSVSADLTELERLQDANDRLQAEVDSLREQVRKLEESSETLLEVADSIYDLEHEVARESMRTRCYRLDDIGGWEVKGGAYTVKVDGPALECEAAIDADGMQAGVKFDARLVGLVFEVD